MRPRDFKSFPGKTGHKTLSGRDLPSVGATFPGQHCLEEIKPEATYFYEENGKRTTLLVVDLEDASQMPAVAEPWFLGFNAAVEFHPAMVPEDLQKAAPAIEQAVKNYG